MSPDPHLSREILTDLYELTMAASYFDQEMFAPATFSLFVRKYPPNRSYFVCAGLDALLDYLESFQFRPDDLDYLEGTSLFSKQFLDYGTIVVGRHGLLRSEEFIFGSISSKIVSHARNCTVWVVE